MRLSWYANTGVAVFSIWQGGTCTGTFRLPIADLPRMIDTLRRGPHGDARDPAEPAGEYRRPDAHGRYEQDARTPYRADSAPSGPGGYHGDYEDEPTGVYRGDLLSDDYPDDPGRRHRDGGHRQDPRSGHPDDPLASGHLEDPPGGYRNGRQDPRSGHPDDPLTSRYPEDPADAYRDDRRASGYREDPPAGYLDDPLGDGYRDDPLGSGDPAGRHTRRYREDPPTGGYREDPLGVRPERHDEGYPDSPLADYPEEPGTARYAEDPLGGDYPTGPSKPGYPDAIDGPDNPVPSGNAGYSPARPYVAPGTGEGRRHRRAADHEESESSPDFFRYGQAPAYREVHGHGR